jgi:uncharacterized protein YjcR
MICCYRNAEAAADDCNGYRNDHNHGSDRDENYDVVEEGNHKGADQDEVDDEEEDIHDKRKGLMVVHHHPCIYLSPLYEMETENNLLLVYDQISWAACNVQCNPFVC